MAGGTDLLVELDRGVRPGVEVLVDLTRIPGLDRIEDGGDHLRLGGLVTHNQAVASSLVVDRALPLAQACLEIGSPALRNRATIAGNLVTASPANDTVSALWALDARVRLRSVGRERSVPVRELFTGLRQTVIEPGELLVSIEVPALGPGQRGVFVKLGQRRAQAISIVHLAAVLSFDGDGVTAASLALGSVAPTVVSAAAAERHLVGRPLDAAAIAEAARLAAASVTPIDDVRATAVYRSHEIEVMVRRALTSLREERQQERWPASPIFLWGDDRGAVAPAAVCLARRRHAGRVHHQRRRGVGRPGRGRHAARLAARRGRAHGHQGGLRGGRVRSLHRPPRWRGRAVVPGAGGAAPTARC